MSSQFEPYSDKKNSIGLNKNVGVRSNNAITFVPFFELWECFSMKLNNSDGLIEKSHCKN